MLAAGEATRQGAPSRRRDLLAVVGLVGLGYLVMAAAADRSGMTVVPAFLLLTLPPLSYLAWRARQPWRRITVGVVTFGLVYGLFWELVQESAHSYSVTAHVFPRLLGLVPPDSLIAHMLMTLLTLTFYEHFAQPRVGPSPGREVHGLTLGLAAVAVTVTLHLLAPAWLDFSYSYAWLGTLAVAPPLLLAWRRPAWLRELMWVVPFFFGLYLALEVVAVTQGWWVYPADRYLGWVTVGGVTFPFEELFFWMILYAPALVSYYEIFVISPQDR